MKVKPYVVNQGRNSQFYILVAKEPGKGNDFVLTSAPNNWKTERGAVRWAEKNGFNVIGKTSAPKKTGGRDRK